MKQRSQRGFFNSLVSVHDLLWAPSDPFLVDFQGVAEGGHFGYSKLDRRDEHPMSNTCNRDPQTVLCLDQAIGRKISPERIHRLANFFFEVGMLRKTPRTGYQFLGSGGENVAEHSFRTAVIGYVLATLAGADALKTVAMALFHDLHEARIGDFNYVNRIYNSRDTVLALEHTLQGTGLDEVMQWWQELEAAQSLESLLVHDADQLDLILNLKQEQDLGNPYARKWLDCALPRLRTDLGRELAAMIAQTDHTDWWFCGPDPSWWQKGRRPDKRG